MLTVTVQLFLSRDCHSTAYRPKGYDNCVNDNNFPMICNDFIVLGISVSVVVGVSEIYVEKRPLSEETEGRLSCHNIVIYRDRKASLVETCNKLCAVRTSL